MWVRDLGRKAEDTRAGRCPACALDFLNVAGKMLREKRVQKYQRGMPCKNADARQALQSRFGLGDSIMSL